MEKRIRKKVWLSLVLLFVFALWTILVYFVDRKAIGPNGSSVGFAKLNAYFRDRIGVRMPLYTITDWLGLLPIAVAFCFALFGLLQWIKRKNFFKVDRDILALGIFYIAVITAYIFFESVTLNYRPVRIDGYLEGSYPSSTTLLTACVMPTAAIQIKLRIKSTLLRRCLILFSLLFTAFMVIGRILAGVHWITDIIGGLLLSAGLVTAYTCLY